MGIFSFLKRQRDTRQEDPDTDTTLDKKLNRTRSTFKENLLGFLRGKKPIDAELLEELENQLIMADVGVEATSSIMAALQERDSNSQMADSDALRTALKDELQSLLEPVEKPLVIPEQATPFVILVVGVNGAGKTTTIGKLAKQLQLGGKSVMLAAGDTFRAAAIEQLQTWGKRNEVPVIAQQMGSDSASVIFDAFQSATALSLIHI